MVETRTSALVSIPAMILLGLRHALDVDRMAAIDNLVRQHNAEKKIKMGWCRI
jgi:nickel/cobalt transporter (NiCoT) family protein